MGGEVGTKDKAAVNKELHRFKSMRFKAADKYAKEQMGKHVPGWDAAAIVKARRAAHAEAIVDWHVDRRGPKIVFDLPS